MKTLHKYPFWLRIWVLIAANVTILAALLYGTVQHTIRLQANDQQNQIINDAVKTLGQSGLPTTPVSADAVDLSTTTSPFIIVFNTDNKPIYATGQLNGQTPVPPSGVFNSAKNKTDSFTWQPQKGVRIAAVISKYSGTTSGYILAGQSLRDPEKRVNDLGIITLIGWLFSLVVSFLLVWLFFHEPKEVQPEPIRPEVYNP